MPIQAQNPVPAKPLRKSWANIGSIVKCDRLTYISKSESGSKSLVNQSLHWQDQIYNNDNAFAGKHNRIVGLITEVSDPKLYHDTTSKRLPTGSCVRAKHRVLSDAATTAS